MAEGDLDRIHIRDLHSRCIVGIYPEERREKQDVHVDLTLYANLAVPCKSDRIADTIDYKEIKKQILATIDASEFFLIERLAEAIADVCLAAARVERVKVTVDKPGALRFARSVAVEIVRE